MLFDQTERGETPAETKAATQHTATNVYSNGVLCLVNDLTHSAPQSPKQGFECNTMRGRINFGMILTTSAMGARGMDEASKVPSWIVRKTRLR
jgi:hypothetical protein